MREVATRRIGLCGDDAGRGASQSPKRLLDRTRQAWITVAESLDMKGASRKGRPLLLCCVFVPVHSLLGALLLVGRGSRSGGRLNVTMGMFNSTGPDHSVEER